MLSLKRYGWRFVLGAEVAWFICLAGAYLPMRTARADEFHHTFFETFPGFVWGSAWGVVAGAFDVFVIAWAFAAWIVWMHNKSIVRNDNSAAIEPKGFKAA